MADAESETSSWHEAVQRVRTTSMRRSTENLIQTLRPQRPPISSISSASTTTAHSAAATATHSAQNFDDTRKQGLAILLAFLDVVGIRATSWHVGDGGGTSFSSSISSMVKGHHRASNSNSGSASFAFDSSQRSRLLAPSGAAIGSPSSSVATIGPSSSLLPSAAGGGGASTAARGVGGRPRNRTMIQSYIQSRTDVLFSGFLHKQGVSVKSWKRRYVILRANMLMYQKTEQGGDVKGKRGGVIPLNEGSWSVEPVAADGRRSSGNDGKGGREHCFALYTRGRTLLLSAETAEQKDAWIGALNKLRSRAGDEALRRGVRAMFAVGAAGGGPNTPHAHTRSSSNSSSAATAVDVVPALTSLLHTLQYEVDSLCEFSVLKEKMIEALDAMEAQSPAAAAAGAAAAATAGGAAAAGGASAASSSSASAAALAKMKDLGEMEIDPSEVIIKDLLAEGFFGKVFRGEMHGLDVAIKKLKTDSLKTADPTEAAELIAELRAEVDVLTHLRHPNVVLIMGASTKNPANLFIVTEFLDRGCLYNVIHNPKLSDDQTLKMIEQVVLAINFLHGRTPKIIHRDIKPLNILVDSAHNIRVGDFGISCRDREKESRDQTQGTFAYMAPEVVTGQASASSASDVFSFGVVLYEWFFIRDRPGIDFQTDDDYCYENIHDYVHSGREPKIPTWWHPLVRETIRQCLSADAAGRPAMSTILSTIRELGAMCNQAKDTRADSFALRRFAVTELTDRLLTQPAAAAAAAESTTTGTAAAARASVEVLLSEQPDALDILLGLSSYAGSDSLKYDAICIYLRVAEAYMYGGTEGAEGEEGEEAAASGADRAMATEMQAAAVNVLANMPLTDWCEPGKRWVAHVPMRPTL